MYEKITISNTKQTTHYINIIYKIIYVLYNINDTQDFKKYDGIDEFWFIVGNCHATMYNSILNQLIYSILLCNIVTNRI